jgi:hypothetical protein
MFCSSPAVCFYLLFLSIASICYPFWWPCECKFQIKLSLLPSFTRGVIGSHVDFHEMELSQMGPDQSQSITTTLVTFFMQTLVLQIGSLYSSETNCSAGCCVSHQL